MSVMNDLPDSRLMVQVDLLSSVIRHFDSYKHVSDNKYHTIYRSVLGNERLKESFLCYTLCFITVVENVLIYFTANPQIVSKVSHTKILKCPFQPHAAKQKSTRCSESIPGQRGKRGQCQLFPM